MWEQLVSFLVTRHYYLRSVIERLSVYSLLVSRVFERIDPTVRGRLSFSFADEVIDELSQVELIIANTGERAISGFIEPPSIELPSGSKVLDASIEYRNPEDLRVSLSVGSTQSGVEVITLDVPLLNKGGYFAARLLVNGAVGIRDLSVRLLAEDLPRQLPLEGLSFQETVAAKPAVDWRAVVAGTIVIAFALCIGYSLWLLHAQSPQHFASSSTFEPTLRAVPVNVAMLAVALISGFGGRWVIEAGFGAAFSRKPRFSLPGYMSRARMFAITTLERDMLIEALSDHGVPDEKERPGKRAGPIRPDS